VNKPAWAGWYAELATFAPPLLLISAFVAALLAKTGRHLARVIEVPESSAAAAAPFGGGMLTMGWLVIATIVPWLMLSGLLLLFGLTLYWMVVIARRVIVWANRAPAQNPPQQPAAPAATGRLDVLSIIIGAMVIAMIFLIGIVVAGGWYEYRVAGNEAQVAQLVNQEGWQIVPNQQSTTFLRRARLAPLAPPATPLPTRAPGGGSPTAAEPAGTLTVTPTPSSTPVP